LEAVAHLSIAVGFAVGEEYEFVEDAKEALLGHLGVSEDPAVAFARDKYTTSIRHI
jgi:hypothetical protein